MTQKKLDIWWNQIDLNGLQKMIIWPNGYDANDFIDYCDEVWSAFTKKEKQEFYNKYNKIV